MKRTTPRQRLLLGFLLVAGGFWVVDSLMSRGGPTPVQAQPGSLPPAAGESVAWEDVNPLLDRLAGLDYPPVADRLDALERDLFMPTASIETALGTAAAGVETTEAEPQVDRAEEFRSRHRLVGVLLGGAPWAVINDRLYPLRAELDGYRLVEIGRDRVVFADPARDDQVVLVLERGSAQP